MGTVYCQCGCGNVVLKQGSTYTRGHHMRSKESKTFYKTVDRSNQSEKFKRTFQTKYGKGIINPSQVKELKEKAVQTRRLNHATWMPNTEELKQKMKKAGRLGGLSTKARWEKEPELFKKFLQKSHETQKLPGGSYERKRGLGNPMANPLIKEKHTKIMTEKYKDIEFLLKRKEKTIQTLKEKYGNDFTKLPWIRHKEEHYRWLENKQRFRGDYWKEIRAEIINRDKKQCFVCKAKRILDVHHLIPIRSGLPITELNLPTNLVTLCKSCHMQIEWYEDLNLQLKELIISYYYSTEKTHA